MPAEYTLHIRFTKNGNRDERRPYGDPLTRQVHVNASADECIRIARKFVKGEMTEMVSEAE